MKIFSRENEISPAQRLLLNIFSLVTKNPKKKAYRDKMLRELPAR